MIDCNGTELKVGDRATIVNAHTDGGTPMPKWNGLLVEIVEESNIDFDDSLYVLPLADRPDQLYPNDSRRHKFYWPPNMLRKHNG